MSLPGRIVADRHHHLVSAAAEQYLHRSCRSMLGGVDQGFLHHAVGGAVLHGRHVGVLAGDVQAHRNAGSGGMGDQLLDVLVDRAQRYLAGLIAQQADDLAEPLGRGRDAGVHEFDWSRRNEPTRAGNRLNAIAPPVHTSQVYRSELCVIWTTMPNVSAPARPARTTAPNGRRRPAR